MAGLGPDALTAAVGGARRASCRGRQDSEVRQHDRLEQARALGTAATSPSIVIDPPQVRRTSVTPGGLGSGRHAAEGGPTARSRGIAHDQQDGPRPRGKPLQQATGHVEQGRRRHHFRRRLATYPPSTTAGTARGVSWRRWALHRCPAQPTALRTEAFRAAARAQTREARAPGTRLNLLR